MKTLNSLLILTAVTGGLSLGQESPKFTFDLGAGFVESVGSTRTALNKTGWDINGGAGLNISHGLGIKLDLGYNYFDINGATLGSIGVPGGDVKLDMNICSIPTVIRILSR
jgi:opacity protein-like surface antigen